MTYDVESEIGKVRLLINDVDESDQIFDDNEIQAFLSLEGGYVRLAAAQAIDTIADNEALCSKVIRTQDLQTDGAKLADSLRKRAASLRERHDMEIEDDGFFEIVEAGPTCPPELTGYF